jgi:hypothetical protein
MIMGLIKKCVAQILAQHILRIFYSRNGVVDDNHVHIREFRCRCGKGLLPLLFLLRAFHAPQLARWCTTLLCSSKIKVGVMLINVL